MTTTHTDRAAAIRRAAKLDALATARVRLRDEYNAIAMLSHLGHGTGFDAEVCRREIAHFTALIGRVEAALATYAPGDVVQYASPSDASEAAMRFVVLEDNGDRAMIRWTPDPATDGHWPFPPSETVSKSDIRPATTY